MAISLRICICLKVWQESALHSLLFGVLLWQKYEKDADLKLLIQVGEEELPLDGSWGSPIGSRVTLWKWWDYCLSTFSDITIPSRTPHKRVTVKQQTWISRSLNTVASPSLHGVGCCLNSCSHWVSLSPRQPIPPTLPWEEHCFHNVDSKVPGKTFNSQELPLQRNTCKFLMTSAIRKCCRNTAMVRNPPAWN